MARLAIAIGVQLLLSLALAASTVALAAEPPVDFTRQIQPLLADRCYKCHGPDAATREADLRFDRKESALAERDGRRAIVPGDADASELVRRITSDDPDERMPPADSKLELSGDEILLLTRWIEEGASWTEHWAFVAPQRPRLLQLDDRRAARNPIDAFVLARLAAEKLEPSPPADRRTLIRRVTLDLTGLPPTPEEVAAFVADDRTDAYERLVDRLLASPRYGEHMARPWLDAARYADTSGYQSDGPREMWRWRDWVIDALNANVPYDQFTIEQLAGDLLPDATLDQRIATGFNRNHRGNAEGGIIAAEYEVEYVVDRVDTTATVWLGLTLGCARCHDHKYDPFTQEEFYRLYAYFNSIPEHGRALKEGNSPPYIVAPTPRQQQELAAADARLAVTEARYRDAQPKVVTALHDWEAALDGRVLDDWNMDDGLVARFQLDDLAQDGNLKVHGEAAKGAIGRLAGAVQFDGGSWLEAGDIANFGYFDKFTLAAWILPDADAGGTIVSRMTDVAEGDGYSVVLRDGRIHVLLVKRWLDDAIRVETAEAVVAPGRWQHVAVTYDGSRLARGIQVFIDGRPVAMKANLDAINQTFAAKEQPVRIGAGGGETSRFHGAIDDVRIFSGPFAADDAQVLAVAETLPEIIVTPAKERTAAQRAKLNAYFVRHAATDEIREAFAAWKEAKAARDKLAASLPTVMVMQELDAPRPAYVLKRGQYDAPGPRVERGVPASLPALAADAPLNRLGLAEWIVARDNPLTARVAVNRQWQQFFGAGLVRTTEDFGTQGEPPSHPELLDWLAVELMDRGWDMKWLHRLIVTSGTYRQSSHVLPQVAQRDPENRLLARASRLRLSAQAVRDQALAASGLLVEEVGGPSVKPYQPAGLWEELAGAAQKYPQGHGADLYRRSLYTYWKRTAASPLLTTLDASVRETCVVRGPRTNTPLQALALLNETTFVEAARMLAQRALRESPDSDGPLVRMFELATCRQPTEDELSILRRSLDEHRARFSASPREAEKLLTVGEAERDGRLDAVTLAAHAVVANLILNLDEVVTRE